MTAAPQEKCLSSTPPASDVFSHMFSPGTAPQPPGTDNAHDATTDLLVQMFMSELGTDIDSLTPSSPTASPSPPPLTPSSSTASLSPPLPTPSPPAQVPSHSSPSPVPVVAHLLDTDDPFLVNFADLDGLLKDSVPLENPSTLPSPDVDNNLFPLSDSHVQDPLLMDLSECLSLCSPSLSPLSPTHSSVTEQSSDLHSPTPSLFSPTEVSVLHDHSYTSECSHDSSTTTNADQRKRKASTTDAILTSAGTETITPTKKIVKDDKYHVRRQKNNVASQVSRSKRRAKHKDMFSRVKELEVANAQLREQVQEMEREADLLRKSLVQKLAS